MVLTVHSNVLWSVECISCGSFPIIVACHCELLYSEHLQLVKSGRDDLRQDAVMQQFFSLVNVLMGKDKQTAQRQLQMRTYKVC